MAKSQPREAPAPRPEPERIALDTIVAPPAARCVQRSKHPDAPVSLALSPGAEPVVGVGWEIATTLHLGDEAFAVVEHEGSALQGWVRRDDVALFAKRSLVFGDALVPYHDTELRWLRASGDRLVVAHGDVQASVACFDVGLHEGHFEAQAPVGKILWWAHLKPGRVELTRTPGGDVVATLAEDDGRSVSVHVDTGAHVQVVMRLDTYLVFGWAAKTALFKVDHAPFEPRGGGARGMGKAPRFEDHEVVTCAEPLPLIAARSGTMKIIGTLAAGTELDVEIGDPDDSLRAISLHGDAQWVVPTTGSRLMAMTKYLRRCLPALSVRAR